MKENWTIKTKDRKHDEHTIMYVEEIGGEKAKDSPENQTEQFATVPILTYNVEAGALILNILSVVQLSSPTSRL